MNPTFLTIDQLDSLFAVLRDVMGAPLGRIPLSLEASPATLSRDKVRFLREQGVTRLSMGLQTWNAADAGKLGRPQRQSDVEKALDWIREQGFPVVNLDLIYGVDGQTRATWLDSIHRTLAYQPEEIYLYPLYVRPLTGLSRRDRESVSR